MNYVDIFLDKLPESKKVSDGEGGFRIVYPGFYNKKPVIVDNGDGTSHVHMLQTREQYETRKALNDAEKPCDMFSECPKKYLRTIGLDKYAPRHTFGSRTHDLTFDIIEDEEISRTPR